MRKLVCGKVMLPGFKKVPKMFSLVTSTCMSLAFTLLRVKSWSAPQKWMSLLE